MIDIQTLKEVRAELKRFEKKLKAAEDRLSKEDLPYYTMSGCKETGAVKRAALDLKMELTRITK